MVNRIKTSNEYFVRVPERGNIRKRAEATLEKIIADNWSELGKDTNPRFRKPNESLTEQ